MVRKIDKALSKFTQKERDWAELIIDQLITGDISGLNIKKLKGVVAVYRVRKGNVRILFERKSGKVKILAVGRRDEDTYKNL